MRRVARAAVEGGRALLREVRSGPLVFTPSEHGYTFRGPIVIGELIAGAVNEGAQQGVSPSGSARAWTREIPGIVKAA